MSLIAAKRSAPEIVAKWAAIRVGDQPVPFLRHLGCPFATVFWDRHYRTRQTFCDVGL